MKSPIFPAPSGIIIIPFGFHRGRVTAARFFVLSTPWKIVALDLNDFDQSATYIIHLFGFRFISAWFIKKIQSLHRR